MKSEGREIRVGFVEDRPELRDGLVALISDSPGFVCAGAFGTMEDALPVFEKHPPDVALIDIGLPGMNGIEGIRRLKAAAPALVTVILTVYQDDDRIFEALCAGACGYLLKKTPAPRLLAALAEAVDGGAPMSPEIARQVVGLFARFEPPPRADCNLTPHEERVLKLLVEGHSFVAVAEKLGVTRPTVAFHVRGIYEKLQVHSRSDAVAKAFRAGLVR